MKKKRMFKHLMLTFSPLFLIISCTDSAIQYICTPCDLPCDELFFTKPGTCPHCNMDLIKKPIDLELNKIDIEEGPGSFLVEGGPTRKDKSITVFYHKPKGYTPDSKILMVVPGAGRNGDSYRDAWIEESEKFGILILSPQFKESDYSFEDYHLGGLIKNANFEDCIEFIEGSNIAQLEEEKFRYAINLSEEQWIFNDLDRLFDLVVGELQSNRKTYDAFGHSAGGHILHRLAIFHRGKVDQIIAANPSFYTLPDTAVHFPFGLKDFEFDEEDLRSAFARHLVVFLGEKDDRDENGGTFLRSPTADQQGLSRVERGRFFYENAKETAEEIGAEFNWKLKLVPNVGHDHGAMGEAAGEILYH